MKRKQHGMSDRFKDGCLCGAVRFVATSQPGYLKLGDQDGLSLPVRIDAPTVPRSSSQEIGRLPQNCNRHAGGDCAPKGRPKCLHGKTKRVVRIQSRPSPQPQAADQSSGGGMR
jgi:hypothetical protein